MICPIGVARSSDGVSADGVASIYDNFLAVDILRIIGGQEHRCLSDILRPSKVTGHQPGSELTGECLQLLWRESSTRKEGRSRGSRRNGIDADLLRGQFSRQTLRERLHCCRHCKRTSQGTQPESRKW